MNIDLIYKFYCIQSIGNLYKTMKINLILSIKMKYNFWKQEIS